MDTGLFVSVPSLLLSLLLSAVLFRALVFPNCQPNLTILGKKRNAL
jgi:hypothetical protein